MKLFLISLFLIIVMFAVILISLMGIYLLVSSSFQKYAPPVRSSGKLKEAVLKDIEQQLEKMSAGRKIIDLGSGWGTLLIPLAKKFPQHHFIGIERAFTPFWFSKIRARKFSNLEFIKEDFFQYDLSEIDIVTLFLIGFMMPKVTDKCLKELPKGAKVYASRFALVGVEADRVIKLGDKMNTYYVYDIK